jgi:Reverse transcriptase (RNA-dependent DNA polymerase)
VVSWAFLKELLISRGFGMIWSNWIENLLMGAKTCVNLNGNFTPYFQCKRGIIQGDPLSPYLFDLVTDALCQLLIRGNELGLLQGLGPMLANGKQVINFHYTDDIIFFIQADSKCVETMVWILNEFEAMSGIRINYNKIELIPINLSQKEAAALASLVGCKLSTFPLKYLGVPLSDAKLKISDWQDLIEKIQHKIPNWKGSLLSMGGRVVFIRFCDISHSFVYVIPL